MQNYNDILKNKIKEIRHLHKLSQSQVAAKLGYKLHTYKNLERKIVKGGIQVTGKHIKDLINAYELESADYFFFDKKIADREQPEFYFDKQ